MRRNFLLIVAPSSFLLLVIANITSQIHLGKLLRHAGNERSIFKVFMRMCPKGMAPANSADNVARRGSIL